MDGVQILNQNENNIFESIQLYSFIEIRLAEHTLLIKTVIKQMV